MYEEIYHPRFHRLLSSGVVVDCLDVNIKNAIAAKYPSYIKQLSISPCSFINYKGKEMAFENKEHAISFVGRLIEYKGIDLLAEQIKNILNKTAFDIYILGRGRYKTKIEEIKSKYDKTNRIHIDFILDPVGILEKTKVFLSLQKEENYPSQSLLEAMTAQNTIIATNVGLTSHIVKPQFGYLISNGDELLERLIYLENHSEIMPHMGKLAKEYAQTNHKVELFHKYMMNIYTKA